MSITRLINSFLPRFRTAEKEKDTRAATLGDINAVVDQVNANFGYVNHILQISQSGTNAPSRKFMATGDAAECKNNCTGDGCPCDCPKECLNSGGASTAFKFAYNGVGDYTLTAEFKGAVYASGIYNVALFLSPPNNYGDSIGVTASSNTNKTVWTFRIKTYGSAATALANGVINGLFAEVRVFTY